MESYREPKTKTHTLRHLRGRGSNRKTFFSTHSAELTGHLYEVLKNLNTYTSILHKSQFQISKTNKKIMFIDENMKHQYNLKVGKIFLNMAEKNAYP